MKATPSERARLLPAWVFPFLAAVVLVTALSACRALLSGAKGRASNILCEPSAGIVDGQPDAGINVKVTVTNVGSEGFISIRPELSTSEGEWSRSQDLNFSKGESKTLTYFFKEPTLMADNIQCRVGVTPSAD